jgi:tetratricopeptide (TPR) repeat protein
MQQVLQAGGRQQRPAQQQPLPRDAAAGADARGRREARRGAGDGRQFLNETKSDDESAGKIKTQIMVGMGKPAEAAALLEKQLAANPNDKKTMLNLAALYMQAEQDAKAGAMFDKMRAAGLLTESKDYDTAFRLLANIDGREKDAMAMIDEGLKKGILQPSYEMYAFQGTVYYEADDMTQAIEAWSKGAPLSKDGEMFLNVAKLQMDDDKWAAAKNR